ncbi:MAG: STAS domain-containing protein [Chloroflexi bacterium]|nr:STAS domain-containing protein [Chloroflexota bacterium]
MSSSREFLEQLQRRNITTIAFWVMGSCSLAFLLMLAVFVANPLPAMLAGMAVTFTSGAGGGLTLLLRKRPLWQMVLPQALGIVVAEIMVTIWLPELRVAAAPFLAVVVLLVSLSNRRQITIATMVFCAVLGALLVALGPALATHTQLPAQLVWLLNATCVATLIVVVWAVSDRLNTAQLTALRVADQRADEAEAARQTAEAARQEIEERVAEQQRLFALVQTLELPVLVVDDHVLLAPLVGNLDSTRAGALRKQILEMVAEYRAQVVIIDVTGITMIDTEVARALIDTAVAIRLLGARTVVSGIRATVAQTLVSLNTGLGDITTMANLGAALAFARREVASTVHT